MDKVKVLLVDDESDFLDIMGARIKGWGYDLIKARNGEEAIQAIEKSAPDIVILDYMMPGMDGIMTIRKIRKINQEIPAIMFTAYSTPQAMSDVEKLGISAFIPKISVYNEVLPSLKATIEMLAKKLVKNK
jgi:CheY-like chemotaxis protein